MPTKQFRLEINGGQFITERAVRNSEGEEGEDGFRWKQHRYLSIRDIRIKRLKNYTYNVLISMMME